MHNNLKTIKRMPKKGEPFIIEASNVNQFFLDSNRVITSEKIDSKLLKDNYLLFTYLGDGLAREYYSSEIFQLIFDSNIKFNNIKSYNKSYESVDNKISYYDDYKKVLKNPLLLTINKDTNIYECDKKTMDLINKNISIKRQLGNHIEELDIIAREILKIHMSEIIKKDYEDALAENVVYKLKKDFDIK